ncbi:MAG: MmgE/PrpD family protein [Methanobacteriaceae archaeon]|mgnify:CR=1 FL=1|nr:MmgE/PrpD family protein [Methanobacteriaceae archaeon]
MIVENISRFILDTNYEKIPNETIEIIKSCFLDYLAVTIRGFNETSTQNALKALKQINKNSIDNKLLSNYAIIGQNENNYFNEIDTAFINGISAHTLDLDDGHRLAQLHPGAVIFSTAIAVAQSNNNNSKEFIEAVLIGYEVAIILGKLVNPEHRDQGFHSTGTIGTFAAGATASKLLKLNHSQIISALGLSGTQSSGLLESDHQGTMGKSLHVGKAIVNGILSVYLAKNGFTGAESIIDGNEGFINSMAIKVNKDDSTLAKYMNENFKEFHINEIYHKKYPFCRHIHSTIDSTLNIKKQMIKNEINLDSIDKITIKTYKIAAEHNNYSPKNKEDLKQSLPFAVAIALICNNININSINELMENGLLTNNLNKNQKEIINLKNLLSKITIIQDNKLSKMFPEKRPSNVNITFNQNSKNRVLENTTYLPLGEKENPLTKKDILEKFHTLNPYYDMNKLKIINEMENYTINEIINKIN